LIPFGFVSNFDNQTVSYFAKHKNPELDVFYWALPDWMKNWEMPDEIFEAIFIDREFFDFVLALL